MLRLVHAKTVPKITLISMYNHFIFAKINDFFIREKSCRVTH
jgi:hypothetical protein